MKSLVFVQRYSGVFIAVSVAKQSGAQVGRGQQKRPPEGGLDRVMLLNRLAADAEAFDQILVARFFFTFEVIQEFTTLSNQFQKTTT